MPQESTSASASSTTAPLAAYTAEVTSVVDGDTIHVQLGSTDESVRLIGIDATEKGEAFSKEAASALTALLGGKTVRLEKDVEERDQYGRLLAYVWVGKTLANVEMLKEGMATLYTVPPNVKYVDELTAAQQEAKTAERGVWGAPSSSPLQIVQVNYDAPGNDNFNLNEEYVVFKVLVSGSLVGYSVEDATGHRYEFPDRVFQKGQTFKLHTGTGTDTPTDLYWRATGSAIWNNNGDMVKVLDPDDQIVASFSY
jgi:micrococcal nuclease